MLGKFLRKFAPAVAAAACISAASMPATAAASEGATAFHQSICQPSGQATLCVDFHSLINIVTAPSETSVFTQHTRARVTATSATGAVLFSFEQVFRNNAVFAAGEQKANVAHFIFVTKVPGGDTCTQHSDSVFANGELRFTNVSFECR